MAGRRVTGPVIIKNEQMTLQEKVIYYVLGFLVVSYFAILSGACWTPDTTLDKWIADFQQFIMVEHHFIVGFTPATPKFWAGYIFVYTLVFMFYVTQIQHPFKGREYGDAKWGDVRRFTQDFGNHDSKNEVAVNFGNVPYPKTPVVVNTHNYWIAEGMYVNIENTLTSNLNMLVVGPPGTGKSFRLARPMLSQLAGNFLVTDAKGELSKQTGQFFEDNGYEVFVINIESEEAMENSNHFNPFRYLRNESDILSLSQILFKATTDPDAGQSSDPFFEQSAETLLTDLLYLMHYTYEDKDKDWKHFVELLESTTVRSGARGKIDNSDPNGIYSRFVQANENWHKGIYTNGEPQSDDLRGWVDIDKTYNMAAETASSVVASLDAHCRYMKLKCVKELLSEDDINIRDSFGYCKKTKASPTGKRILYIVTSEDKRYYDWITSMIYSLFFDELYHLTTIDPSLHDTLPEHLTYLMDEFANVTLPDSFVEKLSTMRSRNMSAVVIIQNLVQLKRKFPNFDMDKDLIANMSIIDILGAPDQDSCEYLSKSFGTMTIHKQTTGLNRGTHGSFTENEDVMQKPLFSAEDMFKMNKDGPCAVVVKGTDPLIVQKCQFQSNPLLPLLTRKTPYVVKRKENIVRPAAENAQQNQSSQADILFGDEAKSYIKECEANGIKVLKLTEADIDALSVLDRKNKDFTRDENDADFLKQLAENSKRALEEEIANTLDFDAYSQKQLIVVQRLKNNGFSIKQIKALDGMVLKDTAYEEITELFNPDMQPKEIEEFVRRLA